MIDFYVNTKAQINGDHEVHKSTCVFMPSTDNRKFLGKFLTCQLAVSEAKKYYSKSNGCYYCNKDCHTSWFKKSPLKFLGDFFVNQYQSKNWMKYNSFIW